jgi:hypothetical protein
MLADLARLGGGLILFAVVAAIVILGAGVVFELLLEGLEASLK